MRVYFAGYPLSGDPAANYRDNPEAAFVNKGSERDRQIVSGAGWPNKEGHDRQNLWERLTFTARKRHFNDSLEESAQTAEVYMLTYMVSAHHPAKGTLKIVLDGDTDGATAKQVVMHDALISPPSFNYEGCLTTASYTVEGPQFEAAEDVSNWLFAVTGSNKIVFTGDTTPAAAQMFKLVGSKVVFDPAHATDPHFDFAANKVTFSGS